MKNLWTTIYVKNMDESVKFYTQVLSLEIEDRKKINEDLEITFLCRGETKFELISNRNIKNISYSGNSSTGFSIESVDQYIEYLKEKNIQVAEGPFKPSPFIKFFFIFDPDGYRIQLVEQIKS